MSILRTRLHKPKIAQNHMPRGSLMDYLGSQNHTPLKLVVAGAGYGKSVTVSQWLDQHDCQHCWISLDRDCNELRLFLNYLTTAVQAIYPTSLRYLHSMLESNELPETVVLAGEFINEMAEFNEELNLVLDDYHLIKNQQIHHFIEEVLKFPLDQLKLFIISRIDPPLRLNTLITYNQVTELRMANLKFTGPEIQGLARNLYDLPLDKELSEKIFESTEGWIIGIRFLLKELAANKALQIPIISSHRGQQNLVNFLKEEILLGQQSSSSLQKLAIQAALFDRFNLELILKINRKEAEELGVEIENIGQDFFQFIEQSLFIIPLDEDKTWFRFHHLIQETLQGLVVKHYSKQQVRLFYRIGSGYFELRGFLREAINYARKGDDLDNAVEIIERNRYYYQDRDLAVELKQLLDILPSGAIEKSASLLLARAFVLEALSQFEQEQEDLDRVLALMESEPSEHTPQTAKLWGEYYQMQSVLFFYFGRIQESLDYSGKSLELVKDEMLYVRDYAISIHTIALQVLGRRQESADLFDFHATRTPSTESRCIARLHAYHCPLCLWNGDLKATLRSADIAFELSKKEQLWNSLIIGAYNQSGVHYFRNELEISIEAASGIDDHLYSGRPIFVVHTLIHKIFGFRALEKPEQVQSSISVLKKFVKVFNMPEVSELVIDLEIEVALWYDELSIADQLHTKATYNPHPFIYSYYYPQLTEVKMWMGKGRFRDMDKAKPALDEYALQGEQTGNADLLIQVYALLSLWSTQSGDSNQAIEWLLKSIDQAKSGGYIRPYLDLGKEMEELILILPQKVQKKDIVQHIKMAFEKESKVRYSTKLSISTPRDILTTKEMAILKLIAEGHQNKEIADKLNFSLNTIKKYVHKLYEKLGVKNRAEAVSWLNRVETSA